MNRKPDLTAQQLKAITESLLAAYAKDYQDNQFDQPHFEQIEAYGSRFKVGFIPGGSDDKTLMTIKLIYKGKI